ncbi:TPA: hypothetical protein EYP38_01960, partial [Candidatus Micrarchaeota archaeon]|nr:hypothetical protein [Candidatus Micrarchaeota archaeon]
MTGPAPGKVLLRGARVFVCTPGGCEEVEGAEVYIHLKGYSRARVTHLDVEAERLNELVPPKGGGFHKLRRADGGIRVDLSRLMRGLSIVVKHEAIADLLKPGEEFWCYVGGKPGGVYIG